MIVAMTRVLAFALLVTSVQCWAQAPTPAPAPAPTTRPFDCLIEPSLDVKLGSPVEGVIADILVDRGAAVRKGQPLVRLNSQMEAAAVESARGRAEFARRKAERNEELYKQQLISVQERDQLDTEAKIAELEMRERETALRLRTVLSPIDGVVVDRVMSPGDQVSRASSHILRLMRLDPLHVEVVAPANLFGVVKVGAAARVTAEGAGQKPHAARVSVIDRVIDAGSGTFRMRLELRNPGYAIPAGLRCRVEGIGG
jgi:membrane fusion protein (multidrug efflux system)